MKQINYDVQVSSNGGSVAAGQLGLANYGYGNSWEKIAEQLVDGVALVGVGASNALVWLGHMVEDNAPLVLALCLVLGTLCVGVMIGVSLL